MPKATNLIEAYNNFVVEPLKDGRGVQGFLCRETKERTISDRGTERQDRKRR